MLENYHSVNTGYSDILFQSTDAQYTSQTATAIEKGWHIVTDYFQIAGSFPKVRAILVPNRNEFDRLVKDLLKVSIEYPSHPARIAQPQKTDIVLLSPAAYNQHSVFEYKPDYFERLIIHEMVHVAEELLSPDIEHTPRWWSEGLATYLSQQWKHETDVYSPVIEGIQSNAIPGLNEIESSIKLAYDWGWTLVKFIETRFGKSAVVKIVKTCADHNIIEKTNMSVTEFEHNWREWMLSASL